MSCTDLRRLSITTQSRPIVTAPAVDPETVQHPVRYSTATTNVTTVENTAFSDGRLKASVEHAHDQQHDHQVDDRSPRSDRPTTPRRINGPDTGTFSATR